MILVKKWDSLTQKESKILLYQPLVASQILDNSCGYHALLNAMISIEIIKSGL